MVGLFFVHQVKNLFNFLIKIVKLKSFFLDLNNDSIYTYFINNQKTLNHKSIIFGLRELNSNEYLNYCLNSSLNNPPIINEKINFTSDYELRIYSSSCFYIDDNNQWQTDGLLVNLNKIKIK